MPARSEPKYVTVSELQRGLSVSRDVVKKALAPLHPDAETSQVKKWEVFRAVRAVIGEKQESHSDRKEKLQADVIEERLRRMRGESLDRAACVAVWGDKMKRLSDAIRGSSLPQNDKAKLCEQLRHEVDRIPTELDQSTFKEYDQATED